MNRNQFYNDIESWIGDLNYPKNSQKELDNIFDGRWHEMIWTKEQRKQWISFLDNYFDIIKARLRQVDVNNWGVWEWKRDIWANKNKASSPYKMYQYYHNDENIWQEADELGEGDEYRLKFMPDGWFVVKVKDEGNIYLMYKEGEFVYYFNHGINYEYWSNALLLEGPIEFLGDREFDALYIGNKLIDKTKWMFLNWEEGIGGVK